MADDYMDYMPNCPNCGGTRWAGDPHICPPVSAPLSFKVLRDANVCRQASYSVEAWDTPRWFMALVGEVGELGNILKKIERGDPNDFTEAMADEIADIQTYLDLLSLHLGINLGEATRRKFNKVSDRIGSGVKL